MTGLSVSVVVVSRHRPEELRRCLRALEFQTLRGFEVVLVSDPQTAKVLSTITDPSRIKHATCGAANISQARNIGVGLASGDLVAFIDDDSIAEPTWLERLTAPFQSLTIVAAGGFVRGRNGISFQWKAEEVAPDGSAISIEVHKTTVPDVVQHRYIKTQGTNCAFRRSTLHKLGGFDENFHFFLDETDLNIRIGEAGLSTAIVPDAEVQHGYSASALRGRDRRPKSLFEIGASQAYFHKKHGVSGGNLKTFRGQQLQRLDKALLGGQLEPRDVVKLQNELDSGLENGAVRILMESTSWPQPTPFKRFTAQLLTPEHVFLSSSWLFRKRAFSKAQAMAAGGVPCSVIVLSLTALFHRRWFHDGGFWVQSGGIFGKSTRNDPVWAWYRRANRYLRERLLLSGTR